MSIFYKANKNTKIFELPSYVAIAGYIFSDVPAVFKDKVVCTLYVDLFKEYFLQLAI